MRRRAPHAALALGPLLGWLVLSACGGGEEPAAAEPARLVVVAEVTQGEAVDALRLLGDVRGEAEVRVFAQLPERIRELHVREGDAVEEGAPIVTLASELQSSGLAQAGAAVSASEAARDQLRAELARVRALALRGAAPSSQVDAIAAQLRASEAQVLQLGAARRSAGAQAARTVVRAPIAGRIALLAVQAGDTVAPAMPICTLVQDERVRVLVRVTERDYVRIREGMSVEIQPPSMPGLVRAGVVERVSPVLDPLSRTASIEVAVDNPDRVLRVGMVAHASFVLERREGVTLVPARAVVMTPETDRERRALVFVVRDGVASRRSVQLGVRLDDQMEIVDGVESGERVVVEGQHLLRDGARVREGESALAHAAPARADEAEGESEPAP